MVLLTLGSMSVAQASDSVLSDKLSIGGFIDMSYYASDTDGGSSTHDAGIDQVEINVGYDFGNKLTAAVDIEYQDQSDDLEDNQEVDIEQAFINYAISDSVSIKAGRFLSYSGWETEEPTGLFQYSGTGYGGIFYGGYQQGVSALYSGDGFSAAVSIVNDLGGEGTDTEHPAVETMVAFMPSDSITIKGFYSKDGDVELLNTWASYSVDSLTLAAEYNTAEDSMFVGSDASGYLLMANYGFSNDWGFTVRYHDYEVEDAAGATFVEQSAITLSPSYVVNDNLLMVFEYRMNDNGAGADVDELAIEALVTF